MPGLWNPHSWPDVVADPLPAPIRLNAGENVEASFEPVIDSLRDFDGLVLRMVRGENTVGHGLASVHGEIRVQLNHGVSRGDRIVAINLDLVVILRGGGHAGND